MDGKDSKIVRDIDAVIDSRVVKTSHESKSVELALSILGQAIRVEKLKRDYFSVSAGRINNKNGKSMFRYLAAEEADHLKTLEAQYQALKKDGKWLMLEKTKLAGRVCPLVTPEKKGIRYIEDILPTGKVIKKDTTDIEALKIAIEIKKRVIKFYCEAASKTKDEYGKKMFDFLIEIETKHLRELEVQYAWLDQAGFWYDPHMMTD